MPRTLSLFALILIVFLTGCAGRREVDPPRAQEILAELNKDEKYRILRSYRFLQTLLNQPGKIPVTGAHLPGVPRVGIPSVEFVGARASERRPAGEGKTLRLGFVNLIRDSEKTQVFGSFEKAGAVGEIMEPEKTGDFKAAIRRSELRDLDLFLVQESSRGRIKNFVCAQYHAEDDFACVPSKMGPLLKSLGLQDDYDEKLAEESLSRQELDRLLGEVLGTMEELRLIEGKI